MAKPTVAKPITKTWPLQRVLKGVALIVFVCATFGFVPEPWNLLALGLAFYTAGELIG